MTGSDDIHSDSPDPAGGPVDDREGGRGPARAAPRSSLFLLTVISLPDGRTQTRARVRNLSATGLMADCETPLLPGQRVRIDLRGVGEVDGVIAWSVQDRIGIAFDTAIDPALTRKPVGGGAARPQLPDYLRGFGRIRG